MAKEFWIDHSDPPYPAIRHRSHPQFEPQFTDLMTLIQARNEIKEQCRRERQHWLSVMHHQIDISGDRIIREAKEARETDA
jgi:hypothetical protein